MPNSSLFRRDKFDIIRGSPCRVWTYDPPVNSRMLYRWANEEYNAATTYPPGQLPDKYFRRSEA